MYNAVIRVDTRDLGRALETIEVCQATTARVKVLNVPQEAEAVLLVVFKGDGNRFKGQPLSVNGNGDWTGKLAGALFPATGSVRYELVGVDADGDTFGLGFGRIEIYPFQSGSETAAETVTITAIPDATGVMHNITAVKNEDGEWTWQVS